MKSLIAGLSTAGAVTFLLVSGSSGAIARPLAQSAKPFLGTPQATVAATPSSLPAGFSDSVVFSGLTNPTNVRFSTDGRVFVAEKRGLLKVFDNVSDATPTQVVDLRQEVDDYWDRGMLGLALDPNFPTTPYVYLLYTYDGGPGQTAPVWSDGCPTPPGPTTDGCVVTGKLVRLQLSGNSVVGSTTLISGEWCQQFPSHSIGDLNFGLDGDLYVSGGDGASFDFTDYGQAGGGAGSPTPKNPCGDPPAGVGGTEAPPKAEGGALRSQSVRRTPSEPVLLDGALLRVDPATGAGAAGNPLASSTSANARRIVAYGMRNPFRFVFRPGTNEVWIGDVGWNDWEEIDRLLDPTLGPTNLGWPCYEGNGRQAGYQSANLNLCNSLYSAGTAVAPYYTYSHGSSVVSGDGCSTANGSVISALSFYAGSSYPSEYNGALFFGDHSRNCIWALMPGTNGLPDPLNIRLIETAAANPVDIERGPGGDLYYVDFDGGTIHRISFGSTPTCSAGTWDAQYFNNTTLSGTPALEQCESSINHDWGSGSPAAGISADGFSVRWSGQFSFPGGSTTFNVTADDGIRLFLDGTPLIDQWQDQSATFNATTTVASGTHTVTVEYYDSTGPAVARATWQAAGADTAPVPVIDTPSSSLTYAVGDAISFSGHAADAEDGTLPASALTWTLIIHHCTTPTTCHIHDIQSWSGVSGGSLNAPDHSYPSYLELQLTATDSANISTTTIVSLQPKTVDLTFASLPSGLSLVVDGSASTTPFTRTVIQKSANSLSATSPQTLNGIGYAFSSWSDGGAATHNIAAPTSSATYTAAYTATVPGLVAAYAFAEGSGSTVADVSGNGNDGTLVNTTWAAAGKYGKALSFNGTSSRVTVPDSASLRLASAMTLEAWVNPATATAVWRDVIYKGDDNYYLEGTSDTGGRPGAGGTFGHVYGTSALPLNSWTHLAVTYDRTTIRLYVNGTQVSSLAATGAIATSSNPLSIGGDAIYGQYFSGLIDDVRVYNTALTQAQIQTDMTTPVAPPAPDTTPPSAPGTLTANAVGSSRVDLSWGAASDDVAVTGYHVERCQGTLCTSFAEIGTTAATSYSDTSVAAGTSYGYRVRANDAVPNLGPYSNAASATTPSPDTTPPSAPGTLTANAVGSSRVDLSWGAASDDVAVTGYHVERCQGVLCTSFAEIGTTAGTSYSDTSVAAGTSYGYRVRANDAVPNLGPYSNAATATTPVPSGPTPVAAYAFAEGSGSTVADVSGNGNDGTLVNTTWAAAGKYGKALSFNGTSSRVTVPDSASLRLASAMTLEAWVNPATATAVWRDVIYKGDDNYYLEGTSDTGGRPGAGGTFGHVYGTSALPLNSWTHLAVTYDRTTIRLYVNGTQVSSLAATGAIATSSNPLSIGGDAIYGQYFSGLIDDVRVYNTALTQAQIQTDMTTPVAPPAPDTTPPSAPGTLTANAVGSSRVDLSWGAASDDVAVTGYHVERCQGTLCTSFAEIGTTAATSYSDTSVAAGTSYGYRVRANDAVPNLGPYSNAASATTPSPDTTPPSAPGTLTANAVGSSRVDLSWGAASDDVAVTGYHVERCQGVLCTSFAEIATTAGTSYSDTSVAAGTSYGYRVRANDAVPNLGPYSNAATATTPVPSGPTPVAAYAFAEGSGSTVADVSGNGNDGTLVNTTWAAAGKYGKALSFNGTSSRVTVPDSASLRLASAMTLEAWVNPATATAVWRDVIYKGDDNYYLEGTSDTGGRPGAGGTFGHVYGTSALPLNSWTHLAVTYDRTTIRLYVNGTQVSSLAATGAIATSSNPLSIGGDAIYGQYFSGLIDDVRVYNTALTQAQIQTDMTTPVGN